MLGFYSDDFNQMGTEDERIACEASYGVNFPTFQPIHVNGVDEHPIYSWLKAQPGGEGAIGWNFVKFLLDSSGTLVARYDSATTPLSNTVKGAIESLVDPP